MFTLFRILFISLMVLLFACGPKEKNKAAQGNLSGEDTTEIAVGEDVKMESGMDFLISANMNSQLQIKLSKAALLNSNSPKVKALSENIIAENEKIQANTLALAEAAGIEMAPALSPEYVDLLDSVQSYSGEKFDSAFVATIIEEHEEDIGMFSGLAARTDDPITREQVTDNLKLLQSHLQAAREIQDTMEE